MKKFALLSFSLLLLVVTACAQTTNIEITNPYPFDRVNEIIEIKASEIGALAPDKFILTDENNQEVPYQLIFNGTNTVQSIIFPINVKTGTRVTYTLRPGTPSPVKPITYARFVPERKDDLVWENNISAFRIFGPALANENPSSGFDLWLKKSEDLVVDSLYRNELLWGKSYHEDHGLGLDAYKVGKYVGAGGVVAFTDSTIWGGRHFDTYVIHENGPLRSSFTVTYKNYMVNGQAYTKHITITTNAHTVLNTAVVKLEGPAQPMQLATGINLHDGKGRLQKGSGMVIYGEDAVSDAGVDVGQNWVAVVLPQRETDYKVQELTALLLTDYVPGTEFTYFFGGGWSQWKFPTQPDWLAAVQHFSRTVRFPATIEIKKE